MTLKIHVIYDHYEYFFEYSGNTMKFENGEFTETTHSTFKISKRQHNFHVNRMLGTPVHKEKAMKSIVHLILCLLKQIKVFNQTFTF